MGTYDTHYGAPRHDPTHDDFSEVCAVCGKDPFYCECSEGELKAAYPDVKTDTGLMALLVPMGPAAETSALYQAAAHFIAAARRQSGVAYFDNLAPAEIQAEFRGWLKEAAK